MKDKGEDAPDVDEKKERVIHMRVAPSLDSELKERASRLGVSVSNLVRNVLQHAFGLAGDVIKDGAEVARSARGEPPMDVSPEGRGRRPSEAFLGGSPEGFDAAWAARDTSVSHPFPDPRSVPFGGRSRPSEAPPSTILGWQRFVLGLNALCERCNALLPKGLEAGLGVLDGPGRRPVVCLNCFEELTRHELDVDPRTDRDDPASR